MTASRKPAHDSIAHYDRNASAFDLETGGLDLGPLYERFLVRVPPGGRILDAGCGAGRDALAFVERGYQVVAFDASQEMVGCAHARVGHRATVQLVRFEDIAWGEEFDGVWACASLLHVPPARFAGVAARLLSALRPGGVWYMSFKLGESERVIEDRLFVDHTEATLRAVLLQLPLDLA